VSVIVGFGPGETITREGDRGDAFYFDQGGESKVVAGGWRKGLWDREAISARSPSSMEVQEPTWAGTCASSGTSIGHLQAPRAGGSFVAPLPAASVEAGR
jgi:hypothetical protein